MKFKDILGDVIKMINAVSEEKKKNENKANENKGNSVALTPKDAAYDKLDKIDEAYRNNPDRTYGGTTIPNLKEKTYDAPGDDEIKRAAESEYAVDAEAKKRELGNRAEEKKKTYADEIGEIERQTKDGEIRIGAAYDKAKENASDEALKRGIARSSIISEQLKELDEAKINDIEKLYENKKQSVAAVNKKISELSDELSAALDKLDIETAVKVNKRIAELKDERRAREDEVLEYNNAIKEKRAKILTELGKQGVKVKEENSQEYIDARTDKLRTLYDYYKSTGGKALNELEADRARIEKYVGSDGYVYLKNMLS